ncbi:MAG: glycosyltransferase family 39 protein, partial [Endomicrobia bacterium]|nr:glycosyltransferase family 39 protein [Endomicrobiia bacterium]
LTTLFLQLYLKVIAGIELKDVTSTYRIYRKNVIQTILKYLTAKDQFITIEINYLCKIFGFKFAEVPITFHRSSSCEKNKSRLDKIIFYPFRILSLVIKWFLQDRYNLLFIKTLILFSFLRVILSGTFGLTDDESHYWQYSQYLDLSYYDHPPMVGYLIYLSTKIFGNNLYAVRLPAILCFLIATVYFYRLVKLLYDAKIAYLSSFLLQVIPVSFVGSIVTLPDAPLGMFWMMYIFYFYKFFLKNNTLLLYFCGLILGLAMLSKYHGILLFVGSVILMLSKSEFRKIFIKRDFLVYCGIALLTFLPVVLWNIAHGFASFGYQLSRANSNGNIDIFKFFFNLGYQAIYFTPLVILFMWYGLARVVIKKEENKYLLYFSLPGIVMFNLLGFKVKIWPHWLTICYLTALPILVNIKKKVIYYISVVNSILVTFSLLIISLFSLIKIPERFADADTPDKLYGWEVAAKEMQRLIKNHSASFIITTKSYTAGQIRFNLAKYYSAQEIPKVYCFDEGINQYDFWLKDLFQYNGKNAILIIEGRYASTKKILNELPFKNIQLVSVVTYRKSKHWPKRTFEFYFCENFNFSMLPGKFIPQQYNNFISTTEFYRNYDKLIFLKINQSKIYNSRLFRTSAYIVTNLGSGLILVPLVIIILFIVDKKNFGRNVISFIIIISFGGLLVQILKNFFDKPRPLKLFSDILHQPINVIGEQLRELGFPSGHTFLATSSAMFLSERLKKWWLTFILFLLAVLVGMSRVIVGAHFLSDVIGGFLIGIIFTKLCLRVEEELK